jgi:ASCH domain
MDMQISVIRCAVSLMTCFVITAGIGCASSNKSASPATAPVVMAPPAATKPVAVLATLKFNPQSIKTIMAGTKTATIRKGVRTFPSGVVEADGAGKTSVTLQDVVTVTKKMSELTQADAKANGSSSLDELKTDLAKNYPGIEADDLVTVITFHVAPGDAGH